MKQKFSLDGIDGKCRYWNILTKETRICICRQLDGCSVMIRGAFTWYDVSQLLFISS